MIQIGTFTLKEDERRVNYAQCPKYDEWVDVKAGTYPVVAYEGDILNGNKVMSCYVRFDTHSEHWYGFIMGKQPNFTPAEGWKLHEYTYIGIDGEEKDTVEIIKVAEHATL